MTKLKEIASTIRSKNAGVDQITFDVIFLDREQFEPVRDSKVLNCERICALFHLRFSPAQVN